MFHCETTLVYTLHKFSITTFEGSLQNEINNFCNECQNFFTLHCQYWPQKSSASQVPVLTGSGNEFSEWSHSWVPCNHSYCCEVSLKTLFLLDVIKSSTHNKMAWQKKKREKKKEDFVPRLWCLVLYRASPQHTARGWPQPSGQKTCHLCHSLGTQSQKQASYRQLRRKM